MKIISGQFSDGTFETFNIFKNEYDGAKGKMTFYNMSLSKKGQDGNYENASIQVRFKKDVVLKDKMTKIVIQNAWLDFYKKGENETVYFIFINNFSFVDEEQEQQYREDIANSIIVTDDLPF